jgi:hypothetical protein
VIVCGCGYRNEIDLGALAAAGELARHYPAPRWTRGNRLGIVSARSISCKLNKTV